MSKTRIRVKHKGSLSKYGFKLSGSKSKQKKAIKRADKHYGKAEVDRKLAALETFNKHQRVIYTFISKDRVMTTETDN